MEQILDQPELLKAFGVFVGLYNKSNNTEYSVKYALSNRHFVKSFFACHTALQSCHEHAVKNSKVTTQLSTRRRSLNQILLCDVDQKVYEMIKAHPGVSRAALAELVGVRISTVCGAVNRLMIEDLVFVCGRTVDSETGRKVEALSLTGHLGVENE